MTDSKSLAIAYGAKRHAQKKSKGGLITLNNEEDDPGPAASSAYPMGLWDHKDMAKAILLRMANGGKVSMLETLKEKLLGKVPDGMDRGQMNTEDVYSGYTEEREKRKAKSLPKGYAAGGMVGDQPDNYEVKGDYDMDDGEPTTTGDDFLSDEQQTPMPHHPGDPMDRLEPFDRDGVAASNAADNTKTDEEEMQSRKSVLAKILARVRMDQSGR